MADSDGPTRNQQRKASATARLSRWVALGAGVGLLCAYLSAPGAPLYTYELRTIDSRFHYRTQPPPAGHVVIVAIDERSLNDPRLGRWPWDRRRHAQMLTRLLADGPRAVGFDVIFAEASNPASDQALAEAAARGRVFWGLHVAASGVRPDQQALAARFQVQPGLVLGRNLAPAIGGVVPPLAPLVKVASGGGVIAAQPDPDGVMRRLFLLAREIKTDAVYPTLLLDLAARSEGWDYRQANFDLRRLVTMGPRSTFPMDGQGRALINYQGPNGTIPQISFCDVLDGRFSRGFFRDKLVLVGLTAPGLCDEHPTPVSPNMLGVEIHAQALENLLQANFLHPMASSSALWLALVMGVVAALLAGTLQPVLGLCLLLLMLGLYDVGGLKAFSDSNAVWPMLGPGLAAGLSFVGIAVFRLTTEEKGRRRLRNEFGRYAPPQVVARLDTGEMRVRAAGVKRQVTSLFADVRGFTAWSATADPTEVIRVLNMYFESMTQLAFDVEGTVDNIVGDEIFVTFNAIEDQEDHIARAVDLGLNMIAALDGLNARWREMGILPNDLRIGVGLNTGEALVGSLGSHIRTQYTVLGQSVNLASRLQSLNKELGTLILCTAEVAEAVRDRVELRSHGLQEVRGHPVPLEVFEVLGRK